MPLGPVASNKDAAQIPVPLLLCAFTFSGQSTPGLLVSTTPVTLPSAIGIMPSGFYDGRVAAEDIQAYQYRSPQGVDNPGRVSVHLFNGDGVIWTNYIQFLSSGTTTAVYGFRGATLQMAMVMWNPGTQSFTSDAPIMFRGTCDMESVQDGGNVVVVTANTSHNMATVKLPLFPIQNRCPKIFPSNATQRAAALNDPTSPYWACGYSADQTGGFGNKWTGTNPQFDSYGNQITDSSGNFILCDYLRSDPTRSKMYTGCMARLGNYATTSVAPDGDLWHDTHNNVTGRFGGVQWNPPTYYSIVKSYTGNKKNPAFSFINSAILGQYHNLLYGTQWVVPKIANVFEDGNDTKAQCMICTGDLSYTVLDGTNVTGNGNYGALQVTANGVWVNQAANGRTSGGGAVGGGSKDGNLWWDWICFGDRSGVPGGPNSDTGYSNSGHSALGDPFGSIATIEVVMYSQIFTGYGLPSISIMAPGPQIPAFIPIIALSGNGTTLSITVDGTLVGQYYFPLATTVLISGTSATSLNGPLTSATWTPGSPNDTISAPSSFSGTSSGGYVGALSGTATNPVWVLLDILLKSNWSVSEINIGSFVALAPFCDHQIQYFNNLSQSANHARYMVQFCIDSRKTAAEVVAGLLRAFNAYIYFDQNGLLNLGINQTLADSQPAIVTDLNGNNVSNYNTAVQSFHANYNPNSPVFANGFVAYSFDETNIARVGEGDNQHLDIQSEDVATFLTPNQIYIQFQDMDNQYVVDSLGLIDPHAVTRAGGALQPGGSIVPETLNVVGICNMDQATRIANVYIAERQYGNPAGDARGTQIYTFSTTVKAEFLRPGHIVLLSVATLGIQNQMFRVIKRQDTTDSRTIRITVAFHDDIWYTDLFGQQAQSFYGTLMNNPVTRPPMPWQPYYVQPNSPSSGAEFPTNVWTFGLAEIDRTNADGSPNIQLQITGNPPMNTTASLCQPPLVRMQASFSTSAGTIPAGSYLFQICAVDVNGNYSAGSGIVVGSLPATGEFTLTNIGFDAQTAGYDLFVGTTHYNLTHQLSATPGVGSMPTSITITSLPNEIAYAPPDFAAGFMEVRAKEVIHGGIIGEVVVGTSNAAGVFTVTIGAPPSGTLGSVSGRTLILAGRPGLEANIPFITFNITANTGSVLTVDRDPTTLLSFLTSNPAFDDVVLVSCQANIASATTIGDTGFINAYYPSGATSQDIGYLVRIIAGTGAGQTATITGVSSGTTYTISPPWRTTPNSTSIFIVEEPTWRFNSTEMVISSQNPTVTNVPLIGSVNVSNYSSTLILVQPVVYDNTNTLMSNPFTSPTRLIWLTGAQGTSTVSASTTQKPTQRIVQFSTGGISGNNSTLVGGGCNSSQNNLTLGATYPGPNTSYFTIQAEGANNAESVQVIGGAGSNSVTVNRGMLGTSGGNHGNNATVTFPGSLTFGLQASNNVPNQPFLGHKSSTDINYVTVTDPAGQTYYLVDTTNNNGIVGLTAPAQ